MYSVLQLIEIMGSQFLFLFHSILHRLPVIVVGNDIEIVDDLVESLSLLSPHRHKLVFWRDFTSEEEIFEVWNEEKHDYEVTRTVVCCRSRHIRLALDRVSGFTGWIIGLAIGTTVLGITVDEKILGRVKMLVSSRAPNYGVLHIETPSRLEYQMARPSTGGLEVEKYIVSKILSRKKQSIERIRRLLKKSVRNVGTSSTIAKTLLQLDDESSKIVHDMFVEEVNRFVHAARRAVTILSRVRLAQKLGVPTKLNERSLFEAIGWNIGKLSDLVRFIHAEWHEDFSDCVNGDALVGLGAWVDSMWGV